MSTSSYSMKEVIYTPMVKVVFLAIKREFDKGGFVSLKKIIYAARYAYCEERLWRRVQLAEKEIREGKGIYLNSLADLD